MRFENKNNVLRIFLEGEINSYNADNLSSEIDQILSKETFNKIELDFAKVSYISSAGLRVVLKLKQKHKDVSVVEASLDIYDIFTMTGFASIMTVKKALRQIYVSGATIVGEGYYSTVYRLNDDTIVKVFNHVDSEEQIEKELALAKEAFMLGVPTAISYDIVKVGDKYGVCFEMLDCKSLRNVVAENKDKLKDYVQKYVDLLKKMNSIECHNPIVPPIKNEYLTKLEDVKDTFTSDQYDKMVKLINSIPDTNTIVHGDCHFKNILIQNDNFVLIDMETLSIGHPIFELASLFSAYVGFSEFNEEESMKFFGIPKEDCVNLYNALIKLYFGKEDPVIKDKIALLGYINTYRWYRRHSDDQKITNNYKNRLLELLNKYDNLDVGI